MRNEVLRLEHLHKNENGECLLSDVSLSVYRATLHCLLIPDTRGRSCLVNILRGALSADSGCIYINDKAVTTRLRRGEIGYVSGKSSLIPKMSIAENIFYTDDRFFKFGFKNLKLMSLRAGEILEGLGISHLDSMQEALLLKPHEAHLVEIISSIQKESSIICLDNITEDFTEQEISNLQHLITRFTEIGVTVILISTKYNSLFDVAHSTTIVDSGSTVITLSAPNNSREQVFRYLNIPESPVIKNQHINAERVLRVKGRTMQNKDFDISVHRGEIVGFYDEDRSVTESLLSIVAGEKTSSVNLYIGEGLISANSWHATKKNSLAIINDVRSSSQLFANMSISRNITFNMGSPLYNMLGIRSCAVEKYVVRQQLQILDSLYLFDQYNKIKYLPNLQHHEQMKIVVARWLCHNPIAFIFINPLLCYDDITAHEFYSLLGILKVQGYGVLIVSS